ncbi:MAG: hypothetical protein Q9166_002562 [cf. Caloplaca sp. 2 TL-2023]
MAYTSLLLREHDAFHSIINESGRVTAIGRNPLDLATVVAVSRYEIEIELDGAGIKKLSPSATSLTANLDNGEIIYGVNTGFGGSADARPKDVEQLQRTVVREHHYGIGITQLRRSSIRGTLARILHPVIDLSGNLMPSAWVRASILVRINSLMAGHSGIRPAVVERMCQILNHNILPQIPTRGSISASGDLIPLSYIAGAIQGKSTSKVRVSPGTKTSHETTAAAAFADSGLAPVQLIAKEGLAIINGTAVSAGVAALALFEAHQLANLAQILTSMSVEALRGTDESFDPHFAAVRPHPGQKDCAQNVSHFLEGSQLVYRNDGTDDSLRQDRYSIRTASQWIGPVLEDLLSAHQQIEVELNSVTDNPIIDSKTGRALHGGNFQAKSVTSAVEKVRQAVQSLGRILFAQCTEIINPAMNRGLPPNLTADDPSTSFIMKGIDIMVASLQSELGFLANPVGSHVQTAEMGNQALNSLALISARYTLTALDVLAQLTASHLFILCQALDLRAMNLNFLRTLEPQFAEITEDLLFRSAFMTTETETSTLSELWTEFQTQLEETTKLDAERRFATVLQSLQPLLIQKANGIEVPEFATTHLRVWAERCASRCLEIFKQNREKYFYHPDATPYLGAASKRMYRFVRGELGVPFLHSSNIKTPDPSEVSDNGFANVDGYFEINKDSNTVGSYIGMIYEAVHDGELYGPAIECLREARGEESDGVGDMRNGT